MKTPSLKLVAEAEPNSIAVGESPVTVWHAENSEVLNPGSVAVAVMVWPTGTAVANAITKETGFPSNVV